MPVRGSVVEWCEAVGIRGEGGGAREVTQQVGHTTTQHTHSHTCNKNGNKKQNIILEPKEFTISIVRPNWQINTLSLKYDII